MIARYRFSHPAALAHCCWEQRKTVAIRLALFFILLVVAIPLGSAQGEAATDNDVIRVAERMYCPVCENIPLDECQTGACLEWKEEIRGQLTTGRTDQEVIDSFVARFGDHVVGVPHDPVLRALTVIMPLLATVLAVGVGIHTFRLFGRRQRLSLPEEAAPTGENSRRCVSTAAGRRCASAPLARLRRRETLVTQIDRLCLFQFRQVGALSRADWFVRLCFWA